MIENVLKAKFDSLRSYEQRSGSALIVMINNFKSVRLATCFFFFNPLIPKSDEHLNSPHNITPESHITVTR